MYFHLYHKLQYIWYLAGGLIILTFVSVVLSTPSFGAVIYIDAFAPSGSDGTSRETAFSIIEAGINIAKDGYAILVADCIFGGNNGNQISNDRYSKDIPTVKFSYIMGSYEGLENADANPQLFLEAV
jgi:hypothetical protein